MKMGRLQSKGEEGTQHTSRVVAHWVPLQGKGPLALSGQKAAVFIGHQWRVEWNRQESFEEG